jgi:glucose-fructose oxidoreductase
MLLKSKDKIRYAVVGLGHIAQTAVLPAFRHAKKNSKLVALVSGDKDKLKVLGEKYKVDKCYLYSEYEDLLKSGEIDAVYIATPNAYHRNIAELSVKHGVHVLCEKPLAVTTEDCLSMIAEAEKNKSFLMTAYRLHFEGANLEAIKRAHSKRIGDLRVFNSVFSFQVDSHNVRLADLTQGGGPLYDIGIYCINAARYLFKDEPVEVFAMSTNSKDSRFKKIDDTVTCVLRFPEGKVANFTVSFGSYTSGDYDLIGTKGRLRLEKAYDYSSTMTLKTYEPGKVFIKRFPRRDQFAPELVYFSDCIQRNKTPEPSGEEGLADIKIIEALLLSIDLSAPIKLDEITQKTRPTEQQKITRSYFALPRIFHARGPGG